MIKGQFCRIVEFIENKVEFVKEILEKLHENSFGGIRFDSKLGALCFRLDVAKIKTEAVENEMGDGD